MREGKMEKFNDWKYPASEYLLGIKIELQDVTLILRKSYQNKYLTVSDREFLEVLRKDKKERKVSNLKELINLKRLQEAYFPELQIEKFFSKRELFYLQHSFWQELEEMEKNLQTYIYRFPLLEKRVYHFLSENLPLSGWLLAVAEKLKLSYANFRQWIESWIEIKRKFTDREKELQQKIDTILIEEKNLLKAWEKIKEELSYSIFPLFSSYKKEFEKLRRKMARGKISIEVETDPSFESGIFLFKIQLKDYGEYLQLLEELEKKKQVAKELFSVEQKLCQ